MPETHWRYPCDRALPSWSAARVSAASTARKISRGGSHGRLSWGRGLPVACRRPEGCRSSSAGCASRPHSCSAMTSAKWRNWPVPIRHRRIHATTTGIRGQIRRWIARCPFASGAPATRLCIRHRHHPTRITSKMTATRFAGARRAFLEEIISKAGSARLVTANRVGSGAYWFGFLRDGNFQI